MQNVLTMPVVLRAAITAKQWIAKESSFASSLMGESVSNHQVLSIFSCGLGLMLLPMTMSEYFYIGIIGIAMLFVGSKNLRSYGED